MVQEDASNARIWRQDLVSGDWSVVATVNDLPASRAGFRRLGWYGAGTWLLDVQAHGFDQDSELQPDGTVFKREDGQLMLMESPARNTINARGGRPGWSRTPAQQSSNGTSPGRRPEDAGDGVDE
jgi:hypothetical protein